jgi:Tol biopolymer transport system component
MKLPLALTLLALSFSVTMHAATLPKNVSRPAQVSATGHGDSFAPTFSPDGRFVVFVSRAKNLTTNGVASPWLDVYLHDLENGRTELVSVNTNGIGGGNGNSTHPSVSSNGLFVTFQSDASNLIPGDTNGFGDVFVRDMVAGTTTLVSLSTNGGNALSDSGAPTISADGRRIVYETFAWNIFPNDTNYSDPDIVLYDRSIESNSLVSIDAVGWGSGVAGRAYRGGGGSFGLSAYGYSRNPAISDDGRYVAFQSDNTNMVANTYITNGGVYVRDMDLGTTRWASAGITDPYTASSYIPPTISANGDSVFFTTPDFPSPSRFFRFDVTSGTNSLLASNVALDSFTHANETL